MTLAGFGYPVKTLSFSCFQRLLNHLALSVPDKGTGYSGNVLCTLKLISTFSLQLPIHLHIFHKKKKSL
jgi:hypothetical protein